MDDASFWKRSWSLKEAVVFLRHLDRGLSLDAG
jgi:hypothetical protein